MTDRMDRSDRTDRSRRADAPTPGRAARPGQRHRRARFGWATELVVLAVLVAPAVYVAALSFDLPAWVRVPAMWLTLGLVGLIVVALVAAPILRRRTRRRWRTFGPTAARLGLTYTASDPDLADRWTFAPFDVGRDRQARNVLRGHVGRRPFVVLDYTYDQDETTASGTFWVVLVALDAPLPDLTVSVPFEFTQTGVSPRRLDIDVEDDEFNRRFRVASYDGSPAARKYAVDLLNPRAIEWLLSAEPFEWSIHGDQVVAYRIGELDPVDLERLVLPVVRVLAGVTDNVPAFLYRQYADR